MTAQKVTEWFAYDTKPVHVGVYQRLIDIYDKNKIYYSYWNGDFWCCLGESVDRAEIMKNTKSIYQKLQWRGLQTNDQK